MPDQAQDDLKWRRSLREHNEELLRENRALKSGGGDGTSGSMERIAKLEAHMEVVRDDVAVMKKDIGELKINFATLTVKVSHLPSKWFVVLVVGAMLSISTGLIVFADKLGALLSN